MRLPWHELTGIIASVLTISLGSAAYASPIGERQLVATNPSAVLRNADHSDRLRLTIWYPASAESVEGSLDIGPPGKPIFRPGSAASNAPFLDVRKRPVVLLSHGFGGSARLMAWFGTALARAGYIVVAVDHPGNNGDDPMTIGGAVLFWERPGDLAAALARVEADPVIGAHLDARRVGVAGFSAGGFASLAAIGGRVDLKRFKAFCLAHLDDGVCKPQKEFPITADEAGAFLATPELAKEIARSTESLMIPGIKAAFVMAPAIVQSFAPKSLERITVPIDVVLGDEDTVAPPATNGERVAALVPMAKIQMLPQVGHYDFLSDCTLEGDASVKACSTRIPRTGTHEVAIRRALTLFRSTLGAP